MKHTTIRASHPIMRIDCVDSALRSRKNAVRCELGTHIKFSPNGLLSFTWGTEYALVHDLLILAGVVEFADRYEMRRRNGMREFSIKLGVHDVPRFERARGALTAVLEFLTGDYWRFTFCERKSQAQTLSQHYLSLETPFATAMPFSNGLDSLAVAGLVDAPSRRLLRVRVGSAQDGANRQDPFAVLPYAVTVPRHDTESSVSSRGFKYCLVAALAAYLAQCGDIVLPESGQGVFGPRILRHGDRHSDTRNHPLFTSRMEMFIQEILGIRISISLPRIWKTKGQTISEFLRAHPTEDWRSTKSCWRNSRHAAVQRKKRQCGLCASCLLRRVSLHAAGLVERDDVYVIEDLNSKSIERAFSKGYAGKGSSMKSFLPYAVAAVQYMDDLGDLSSESIAREAKLLSALLRLPSSEIENNIRAVSMQHLSEWQAFLQTINAHSILRKWSRVLQ